MKLPSTEPIHGHVVQWWEIWAGGDYIIEVTATYHVFTRWIDYGEGHGTDLANEWMIARDGCDEGRVLGWDGLEKLQQHVHHQTRLHAIRAAEEMLMKHRRNLTNDIARIDTRLAILAVEADA